MADDDKSCAVPQLVDQLRRDLRRIQTGSNVHDVANWLTVTYLLYQLCQDHCDGPSHCGMRASSLETVAELRAWLLEEWQRRYGPK